MSEEFFNFDGLNEQEVRYLTDLMALEKDMTRKEEFLKLVKADATGAFSLGENLRRIFLLRPDFIEMRKFFKVFEETRDAIFASGCIDIFAPRRETGDYDYLDKVA